MISFLQNNVYAPLTALIVIPALFLGGCALLAVIEGIDALVYLVGRIAGV